MAKSVDKGRPSPERSSDAPEKLTDIEVYPDAWERFEKAVDKVAKSPPQHKMPKKMARAADKKRPDK